MVSILKPTWWNNFATYFSFSNDASATIDSEVLLSTLDTYVVGSLGQVTSSGFLSMFTSILQPSESKKAESAHYVPDNANVQVVLGFGGYDFLAGNAGDNILHGGLGNDYFSPGAGKDLVIGSDGTSAMIERDTVAYLTAASGIVVEVTNGGVAIDTGLLPHQDVYAFSYADWVDPAVIKISDFQGGAGGDFLDISGLLAAVGYVGTNPVADGYIKFSTSVDGLKIQFDPDGNAGSQSGKELVRLLGHTTSTFSSAHNFMLTPLATHTGEDNFLTFVSNDGTGSYDVLYSVENIYGSDHNDIIHGHTVLANTLMGGLGNDSLYGEGGHDILVGGSGNDTIYGGTGMDRIILGLGGDQAYGEAGADTFKFDATIGTDIAANTSNIMDFQVGAGGDKIDISEILSAAGYAGTNPLVDGYLQIVQSGSNTHINIDIDGAGAQAAQTLAVLHNVQAGNFSTTDNLVVSAQRVLLVSALGQSNSEGLRVLGDDTESGLTRIQGGLDAATDFDRIILSPKDENGSTIMPAIGSTRVNGDYGGKPSDSWWFPSTNKPGEILIRAVEILSAQIAELRAAGNNTKPVIIWGQGEGDCVYIGGQTTEAARLNAQNVYKNATLAVFDYIKAHVGADVEFYIMETGRYITQAALNAGISQATADRTQTGLTYIRAAQEQMALERSNVFIATKYTDLPMNYEYDPAATTDYWHFHPETREIIGDRVADFISLRLGYDHILDNPGDYPLSMLSDLPLKTHAGMTIHGNANNNIVVGTLGNDTLTGDNGNDALYGGAGFDQVLYQGNYANYTLTTQGAWLIVTDNVFSDGTDTLIAIERAVFADGFYENGQFYSTVENRNPEAQNDVFEAEVDTVVTGNVLANNGNGADTDADLDPLTVVPGTFATAHGSVTILANGDFTYTPNTGYAGVDGFSYIVEDGQGGSDTANVSITLTVPVPNTPPVAQDDIFIGEQGQNVAGNLLVNNGNGVDSDVDNDPLTVVPGTFATAHGSVTIMANGGFVYTPNPAYFGADSFTYTLQDGQGGSDIGQVSLTIEQYEPPANINPVGVDDGFSGLQDANITGNLLVDNGAGADSDADGGTLSVVAGTFATTHGSVTISANGNFTYTPNAGYTGLDAFRYTLIDGQGGSDLGVVNLNLVPSSVVSGTEAANTMTGTGGNDFMRGLGGNDTLYGEAGDDTLYGNSGNDTLKGRDGNDTMFGADGVDYLEGGNGNDVMYGGFGADTLKGSSGVDTFAYLSIYDAGDTVQDFGATSGEKIDLTGLLVHAIGFQQAEAFTGGYLRVEQTGPNTALYVDMDGAAGSGAEILLATLQGVLATNISLASFILPASGIPAPSNNNPVAQDDVFSGNQDVNITGNLLANNGNGVDTDADGHTLNVVAGTFATTHGSVTISTNGNFVYTPNAGYSGTDGFSYTLQDGHGGSDTGAVALTLNYVPPVNNNPVAQDDVFSGNQDVNITGNLLANNGNGVDTDADGHPLNVVAGTFATTHGTVTILVNGDFTYTPNTGYFGTDGFEYTLQDGHGGSDTGAVSLTLNYVPPVNNNPVAQDDIFSGNQDVQIVGNLLANNGNGVDTDADGHPLNVVAGTFATTHGTVTILANGNFTYTPNAGYVGADGFEYLLQDGHGGSDTGAVALTLNAVNNDDTFYGTSAIETFDGGIGSDTVDYSASAIGVTIDLKKHTSTTGDAAGDTFISIENLIGSNNASQRDTLYGDANANHFYGLAGDDILQGGNGADVLDGGAGRDYARYKDSTAAVNINLETNVHTGGEAEGDLLYNIECIQGSNYNDVIRGGNGNDWLSGEKGNDIVTGGLGVDDLFGGEGADTFLFEAISAFSQIDRVRDFSLAQGDKIDISDLLSAFDPLTQAITDFVQITDNGTDSFLAVDVNGGADHFVQVAIVRAITGITDEEALVTSGNLVV